MSNKLYTANKWNQPAFMNSRWKELADADYLANPWDYVNDLDITQQYMNSQNGLGISKADNPFSKGNIKGTMGGLAQTFAPVIGGVAGKVIAGGLESKAGSAVSNLGSMAGSVVGMANPVLGAAITAGSQVLGGLTNRAVGSKLNQENIGKVEQNISGLRGAAYSLGQANTNEAVLGSIGSLNKGFNFSDKYIGKDGWFARKAKKRARVLRAEQESARDYAYNAIKTGAANADDTLDSNVMANFSAYGGPLFPIVDNDIDNNSGMGAIDYGFMSDYLAERQRQNDIRNRQKGLSQMPAFMHCFAFGGDLQSHGSDFPTGMVHVGAGGSHEESPYDGVQMGTDPEGVPNLVEEGEVVFDDYVYSARIPVDQTTKEKFHIGKKREMTYADLAKKLEKEIQERPNDPISRGGFEKQMAELAQQQERQKQEMEAERAKAAFDSLSPEEQVAVMQQRAMQEQQAQEAMMQQQQQQQAAETEPQPTEEEMAMSQQQMMADGSQPNLGAEPQMNALGGRLFKDGGYLWDDFWKTVNQFSRQQGNTPDKYRVDRSFKGNVKDLENSDDYKEFTNYILTKATPEERLTYFKWIDTNTGRNKKYVVDGQLVDGWQGMYKIARTDGLYGIQHYTPQKRTASTPTESGGSELGTVAAKADIHSPIAPTPEPELKWDWEKQSFTDNLGRVNGKTPNVGRVFHAMDGDLYDGYIEGELDPDLVGNITRWETLPSGDTVLYHAPVDKSAKDTSTDQVKGRVPIHRPEWPRYAGLLGPAVGLGLMAAGVGKPNTASIDAAIERSGDVSLADYKPLGNYLRYSPMDIWYEQNRLNANARATDRAILNSGVSQGSKMAGLLASGYNNQVASGNLYRQALEYNDRLRQQVAEFNRGTDQWNSGQYGETSRFNANARNQARQFDTNLRLQAAAQKADMRAGWYNSLYGNISGLFKGLSDLGTENYRMNRTSEMAADDIFNNLGTSYTGSQWLQGDDESGTGKKGKKKE